jgi:chloramphenicol-sensitive protein RarD
MANTATTTKLDQGGIFAALTAYFLWGVFPILWKWIAVVPVQEVLAYRVIGNFLLLFSLLFCQKQFRTSITLGKEIKNWKFLLLSGALITVNWGIYVYAVVSDRLLEASLGYFINPLVNVALGVVFFQERLSKAKKIAFTLSGIGVAVLLFFNPTIPWLGFAMCLTFAAYGLLRKIQPMPNIPASFLESAWVLPLALIYLLYLITNGESLTANSSWILSAQVIFVSILSASPLVLFAIAAKRLPLSALGFFQYISPSLQFLLAVFAFHESLYLPKAIAFLCIWLALGIYSWEVSRASTKIVKSG